MNDTWIDQQRIAASVTSGEDLTEALQAIEEWKQAARKEAESHSHHATKKAVENCPPTDEAAPALFDIFAANAERIYMICHDAHTVYAESSHADEPSLALEDLLQEAYPLYLRAMVRHKGRDVAQHIQRAFKDRMIDYVETILTERDDPDGRPPIADESRVAPSFDIPRLYNELREDDRLPRKAERAWDRLHPDRTP